MNIAMHQIYNEFWHVTAQGDRAAAALPTRAAAARAAIRWRTGPKIANSRMYPPWATERALLLHKKTT